MQNNLVSQAGQMEVHGIPNDTIPAINQVACIILGPIIQNLLYPYLSKRKIHFRPIARITVGFIAVVIAMGYTAGVQRLIYNASPCYEAPLACPASDGGHTPNHINVWLQTPIYVIMAISEIFSYVTALEYAYAKAPKDMKTIVQAISLLIAGIGAALGMAISPVAEDPKLVTMYAALAGAMVVGTVIFWWRFKKYDSIDEELDTLDDQRQQTHVLEARQIEVTDIEKVEQQVTITIEGKNNDGQH